MRIKKYHHLYINLFISTDYGIRRPELHNQYNQKKKRRNIFSNDLDLKIQSVIDINILKEY